MKHDWCSRIQGDAAQVTNKVEPGTRLGRDEIRVKLGEDRMGEIWLAEARSAA